MGIPGLTRPEIEVLFYKSIKFSISLRRDYDVAAAPALGTSACTFCGLWHKYWPPANKVQAF
jgi:hypothetical protein